MAWLPAFEPCRTHPPILRDVDLVVPRHQHVPQGLSDVVVVLNHQDAPVAMRTSVFRPRPRVCGQLDREDRIVAGIAVDMQRTAHGLDDRPRDVKAETEAPVVAVRDGALEGPEEPRDGRRAQSRFPSRERSGTPGRRGRRIVTSIGLPRPNLIALESRFFTTCSMRNRSHFPTTVSSVTRDSEEPLRMRSGSSRVATSRTTSPRLTVS